SNSQPKGPPLPALCSTEGWSPKGGALRRSRDRLRRRLGRIDGEARPHRGGEADALHVLPLARRGFGPYHRAHERREVLEQRLLREGGLSDRDVENAELVYPVLDLPRLDLLDGTVQIEGDRPRLGVRHQPPGA